MSVTDNGHGIPPEERDFVFRRLYRIKKTDMSGTGTGLGLSLVKAIVDLHSATITLDDARPGLKVSIEFPMFVNHEGEI